MAHLQITCINKTDRFNRNRPEPAALITRAVCVSAVLPRTSRRQTD